MKVTPETYHLLTRIEKWEWNEQSHPLNSTLKGGKGFFGPQNDRKCTDLFWVILFLVANSAFVAALIYIYEIGSAFRLIYGSDFRGEVCGNHELEYRKYLYYPEPDDASIQLCLQECPKEITADSICYYGKDHTTELTEWGCWDSIPCTILGYTCIPGSAKNRKDVLDQVFAESQIIKRGSGDLILTYYIVIIGIFVAVCHGIMFFLTFKKEKTIKTFLIVSMFESGIFWIILTLAFFADYQMTYNILCTDQDGVDVRYCKEGPSLTLQVLACLTAVIMIFYSMQVYRYRPKFKLSIKMVKATCKPLHKVKSLYWYMLSQIIIGLILMCFFVVVVIWTLSMGHVITIRNNSVPGGEVNNLTYETSDKWILVFVSVMVFWWLEFLVAVSEFVVGGAVGFWFFEKEKSVLWSPLRRSWSYCMRYHLGSVIRGAFFNMSFTIPIMLFSRLRALIYPKKDQKFYKFLSHLCCPCLHLYEIVLKYYSKYAYIYLAIFAKPYTISAKESYFLLLRNGKRIKDPLSSSFYSIFMIKLTISLAGFIVCYVLMILTDFMDLGFEKNAVTSRLGPSIFALVISIYVAQIIGGCMEASVSSMIICGACDEEMFSREQRFIEKDFQTALDNVVEEQTEQNKDDRENFDVHKPGHSNRVPANLVKFNDKQDVIWPNSYLGISNRDTDRSVSKIASRIESQDKKILTMKPIGRIETAENKVIRRNDETIHIIDEKSVEFDELKYPPSLIPKDTRFPAYRANLNYNAW